MLKQIGILLSIIILVSSKVPKGMVNAPAPKEKASHFYSETQKEKQFALDDLKTNEVLILILKPKAELKDIDYELENELKFQFKYKGDVKQTCEIKTLNSLCVIPKINGSNENTVKVSCSKLPCEFTFDAVQLPEPKPVQQLKNDSLQYLYKINANESLIKVKSNDPNIDDLASKVRVYVNAPYELINKDNNLIYFDFDQYINYVFIEPTHDIQKSVRVTVELSPEDVGFNTLYRFTVNKTRQIKINQIPYKQLRVDMTLSEVNDKPLSKLNISFIGYKSSSSSDPIEIQTFTIDEMEQGGLLDLNLILKNNAFTSIKHFSLKINSPQMLLVSLRLDDTNIHELQVEEESYISLDKDESIEYKIVSSQNSDSEDIVQVQLLDDGTKDKVDISISPSPCKYNKGCTMKVTAKEAVVMGLGVILKRETKNDLKYIPIKSSLELLLAEGESIHLIHNQTSIKSKKITINSANILVYVAGKICPFPSQKCHQYSGSLQKPILIQNPSYPMYITVIGLQTVRFSIRIDETDSVLQLQNGVALTTSIPNNQGLYLRFKIQQKQDVNFNLIAPLNAFKMYIGNSKQKPQVQDLNLQVSSNFVKFQQNYIDQLVFTILIKKQDNSSQDTFTIIASTKDSIIVLGKGEPHYDVIEESETKHYAILIHQQDMVDDVDTHISFSIFQKTDNVNFSYTVGGSPDNNNNKQGKINRRHDILDIQEYADEICTFNQTDICQLFFSLTNHNSERLDITLTVLTNNTVIQLKPGIWQSFEMSTLTSSSHFYFIPTNKKYPIDLQFSHTYGSFKISYLLWKNENQVTDAGAWPFPSQSTSVNAKAAFQTSDYIIHTNQIAKCFPNCILLVSLVDTDKPEQIQKDENTVAPVFSRFGSYSIMASNNMMQLRQLQKSPITLAKDESKYITIDLAPYLKNGTNVITIYTSNIVGMNNIIAKLSSNRNLQYPTQNDNDYRIVEHEMQIKIEDIKQKLEDNGMDEHEQIELIIMMRALEHSRTIISFTSKENYIEKLTINVPEDVHIPVNSSKYYSVEYYQDVKLKVVRVTGFPSFSWQVCSTKDIESCIEQIQKSEGNMINSKVDRVNIKHVDGTVTFLKLTAKQDPVQVQVTALGGEAATQLKQGETINDFLSRKQTNRYKVSVVKETQTIITITVFEGNPTVTVINEHQNIKITGKKKGNLIQIHIPSSAFKKSLTNNNTNSSTPTKPKAVFSNTALSAVFSELIVQITDTQFNCPYSVSYTLGKRNLYIQDGTLTSGILRGGQDILYSYHNSKNSTAFVAISFQNSSSLQKCEIKYASYSQYQQQPLLQAPAKLEVKSRTPKPSITFQLEQKYSDFEVLLKNKDSKDLSFNITINHVDIVLLPYGYKYPNYIGKNESAYFVIEVFNEGYIQFDLKKCSENPLTFAYALDDQAFEDQTYTFTNEIEDYRFSSFVHVKSSSIFLRIQAEEPTLFSIEANWYKDKKSIPNNKIKAGDNGALEYAIGDNMMATVSFAPLNCEDCHSKNITYEYVVGHSRADVLAQSACEGNFFLFAPIQVYQTQTAKTKPSKVESGKLTFDIKLPGQLIYLGFKAKLSDGRQVFYSILELSTVWGSIQKNKNYHFGFLTFVFLTFLFCCYMYRRRPTIKRGKGSPYSDIPQQFDP